MSNATKLLRRALAFIELQPMDDNDYKLEKEIRAYLAAEPEAEPVAWMHCQGHYEEPSFRQLTEKEMERAWTQYPLYTRPEPARKPMTPKERSDGYMELEGILGPDAHLMSFLSGICAAENHHGIGVDE